MFGPAKRAAILALLVLAPLGVAACGGSDEEASAPAPTEEPATTSLTRSELISAGDGICAEVNAAIGTIEASETSDETVRSAQVADLYAGVAERLEGLGTPSDGEAPTEVIAAATALGDPDNPDPTASLTEFQAAASQYGFTDCAEDPAAPTATDAGGDSDAGSDTGTDAGTDGGTVEPAPAPAPAPTPAPAPAEPPTGGGVAPDSGGGSGGGSSGGSSGGISPG